MQIHQRGERRYQPDTFCTGGKQENPPGALTLGSPKWEAEEWSRVLLPRIAPRCLPPHVATPSNDSLGGAERRGCWPDVQIEDGLAGGLGLSRVVVDDITYLFLLAVVVSRYVPIMAVKGGLGSFSVSRESVAMHGCEGRTQIFAEISGPTPATWRPLVSYPLVAPETERG